jgi:hypothetical protein
MHTATPLQTTQTTAPVRPQRQCTIPIVQPATIKLLGEEIKFSGMPSLSTSTTCLFKKENHASLQADARHAIVEEAIKKVLLKFKLQAISICGNKDTNS